MSQTTFSKTIDFSGNQETAEAVIINENNIFLIGNGLEIDNNYLIGLFFSKTDFQGNVIWRRTFTKDSTSLFSGFNAITDNQGIIYITGAHVIEPYEEVNAFLCSIDPISGDTLLFKEFVDPGVEAGYRIQWLPDSTILIYGTTSVDDHSRILLMNVDTTGQIIFNKYYGTGIVRDSRYFQVDDNGSIAIAFGDEDCDPTGYYFYSIDQVGNLSSTFHSDINCLEWGVPSLTDDGYYIASYDYYIYTLTFFGKLNSDFSYAWKNYFEPDGTYALWAQYELDDGSVIVYGSKEYSGTTNATHAFLRKIDSNGNTIWEREYYTEKEFYPSYIWNIIETAEGELICVGTGCDEPLQENGFLSQNFWLFKLDSVGCLNAGCDSLDHINDSTSTELLNNDFLVIYPNPMHTEATIQINTDNLNISGVNYLEFETYDISGKLINEFTVDKFHWTVDGNKIQINYQVQNLSSGMYMIKIKSDGDVSGMIKFVSH